MSFSRQRRAQASLGAYGPTLSLDISFDNLHIEADNITTIPEPGAVWLFLSGLVGFKFLCTTKKRPLG